MTHVYDAIGMPGDDMSEEETKGLFTGNFWVDGYTSVTVQDDISYLWIFATVHSPQLPIDSVLTLFG